MAKGTIGYGKPPRRHQFRKGRSGNPRGRPKGSKNLSTLLLKSVNERVTVMDEGRPKRISKLEVMHKRLANKGATGDLKALQMILQRLEQLETPSAGNESSAFDEADQQVIQELQQRFRRLAEPKPNDRT